MLGQTWGKAIVTRWTLRKRSGELEMGLETPETERITIPEPEPLFVPRPQPAPEPATPR